MIDEIRLKDTRIRFKRSSKIVYKGETTKLPKRIIITQEYNSFMVVTELSKNDRDNLVKFLNQLDL